MKICYFVGHFPYQDYFYNFSKYKSNYHYDGGISVAYNLALNMAKINHDVTVCTTSARWKNEFEQYMGISIHRYGTNFRLASGNFSINLFLNPPKKDFDIIHTHVGNPIADLAGYTYAKRNKGTPFIITYHGDGSENLSSGIRNFCVKFHNKYLLDKILSRADLIISPSMNYIDVSKFLKKHKKKIIAIPNGVDLKNFQLTYSKIQCRRRLGLSHDDKVILFVGAISPHKGPDLLLKAMPTILRKVHNVKLIIIGKGVMEEKIKQLSRQLGIDKQIEFVGFIADTFRKAMYYNAADIFVLPSFLELSPQVILEAMASGLPIVATNVGGIPDLVEDEKCGLLIPAGDCLALENAVIYLLENGTIRDKMRQRELEKIKDFSWESMAKITEKIYSEILS